MLKIRALLRLPRPVQRPGRSVRPVARDACSRASDQRPALAGNASADLRRGGEGAQHGSRDAAVPGRKRSAEVVAARQGQQAERG